MGNERYQALEKVNFKGWVNNSFDTEDEAIQALIKDEKNYMSYVIIREVYIDN